MKHFSISELCASDTAAARHIANTPGAFEIGNLTNLVDSVLDPLRERYGKPIHVTSGYRCKALNKAVGGVSSSHHISGYAADIVGYDRTKTESKKLFSLIQQMNLPFTQLIWEHNSKGSYWCHVSYIPTNIKRQVIGNLLKS